MLPNIVVVWRRSSTAKCSIVPWQCTDGVAMRLPPQVCGSVLGNLFKNIWCPPLDSRLAMGTMGTMGTRSATAHCFKDGGSVLFEFHLPRLPVSVALCRRIRVAEYCPALWQCPEGVLLPTTPLE